LKNLIIFKRSLIVLLLCLIGISSSAQGEEPIKPLTQVNKQFLVIVHIVYDKDTVSNVDTTAIKAVFAQLNNLFKPISVSFNICEFRYIYNYQYDNLPGNRETELIANYYVPNRINMFFVSDIVNTQIKECGNAGLGGIALPQNIILIKKMCTDIMTIGHEMGHFFSLLHTFDTSNGVELANGSNCKTAGDGVCDTPADPFGGIAGNRGTYIDSTNCTFIFASTDVNGQFYNPDIGNIMSYYGSCACPKFTHDQFEKMATYYLANPVSW
jgi:hypothetical protein